MIIFGNSYYWDFNILIASLTEVNEKEILAEEKSLSVSIIVLHSYLKRKKRKKKRY